MQFKISIDDCIRALQKNLEEHKVELKEATSVWTEQVITQLTALRDAVDRKGVDASSGELIALLHRKPQDNRAEYSKYLGALKLTQSAGEAHIDMDEFEYDRLFNDNWDWRISSKTMNSTYSRH